MVPPNITTEHLRLSKQCRAHDISFEENVVFKFTWEPVSSHLQGEQWRKAIVQQTLLDVGQNTIDLQVVKASPSVLGSVANTPLRLAKKIQVHAVAQFEQEKISHHPNDLLKLSTGDLVAQRWTSILLNHTPIDHGDV
jgi:hypothetical protein